MNADNLDIYGNPPLPIGINKLVIERVTYGKEKGKYSAVIEAGDEKRTLKMAVSHEHAIQFLSLACELLAQTAKNCGNELAAEFRRFAPLALTFTEKGPQNE